MDDVKDKMKGLMKKVNNPFSSSPSGKFKGQGRVLGSSSSPQSSPSPTQTPSSYQSQSTNPNPKTTSPLKVNKIPEQKLEDKKPEIKVTSNPNPKSETGFDPFNSLVTSGKRNPNGYSLNGFECPVCNQIYTSEEEVSDHIETCLSNSVSDNVNVDTDQNQLQACVSAYLSGKPKDSLMEVVVRLLRNVVKEPENAKFRKVRMGNPKIKEAIGDVVGAVELLECIGFGLVEENEEMWLVMEEAPSEEGLRLVKSAISLLEPKKVEELPSTDRTKIEVEKVQPVEPKKIDRQIRVFFSVPESIAAKIELPDSFYNLSAEELKREAETRRKKLEESKLLIPKSYKEKQAKAARKKYNKTVIRIQFPDGVVLQAIFSPSELTRAIYEFVSSALKEPSLEFELLHPVLIKRRVIPAAGQRPVTLEEEDLVPKALIKFKPLETDSVVFTGLCNELLEISEPLVSDSAVRPL